MLRLRIENCHMRELCRRQFWHAASLNKARDLPELFAALSQIEPASLPPP